ncbi:flagellar filament capping protein FliD [Rummeliibacillus sp. NPDC094406]|uniref:flagellar filament capping protein FliD n=1 Tax=Rummeliibacillus sp. NPDC094406 TaxID=3364511 RepID=UPI0038152025
MVSVNNSASSPKVAYSYLQYKNKVSGLVSGMDIDSIMEKLMKAESAQMERLQQQKQKYEWQRDAYREVNTSLSAFRDGIFDNYGLSDKWNAKTATSSSSAISATATNSATGTLTISAAKAATAGKSVVPLAQYKGVQITDSTTMADLGIGEGTFKIKALSEDGTSYIEKEIKYSSTDKVSSIMSKINSSGVGVTAISSGNQVSLTANNAGKGTPTDGSISISEDANGLFQTLGVIKDITSQTGIIADNGKDGWFKVNGIKINGTSNKYSISGYTITVNEDIAAGSTPAKVSSTTDTDSLVNKVKEFVETYNGLIKGLNGKVTEKKNVDFAPLTDAQKAEMSEDEIKKWEEKAKAGLLKGDTNINSALSSMRSMLSQYGSSSGNSLYNLGITTSKTWSENGKLEINEEKLRAAIEKDPDAITKVFNGTAVAGEKGIIANLRDIAKTTISSIEQTAGKAASTSDSSYSLGRTISSLDTKISDWKDRLKAIENRYWNQFSAMETAIQRANSQSSIFQG